MRMITLRTYSSTDAGEETRINVDDIARYKDDRDFSAVSMWFKSGGSDMYFGSAAGVDRLITEAQR